MRKRITAGVLTGVVVTLAAVGGTTPASASDRSAYCYHGYGYGYEHRTIIWRGSGSQYGQHTHNYQHDVNNWWDHYRWQYC